MKQLKPSALITLAGYLSNLLYDSVEKYVSILIKGEKSDLKESVQVKEINGFISDESEDFVEIIDDCLQQYNLAPSCIELEVTESTAMKNPEEAIRKLESIRKLDIELAIDDFGMGHSSLAYLQQLPVQVLKLDRAFVMNIESDKNNATISIAAISLAHSLGFKVVAEGIETEGQAEFLKNNGYDML